MTCLFLDDITNVMFRSRKKKSLISLPIYVRVKWKIIADAFFNKREKNH